MACTISWSISQQKRLAKILLALQLILLKKKESKVETDQGSTPG